MRQNCVVAGALVVCSLLSGRAWAGCTYGEVEALAQALPITSTMLALPLPLPEQYDKAFPDQDDPDQEDDPRVLVNGRQTCQYRLYEDGWTYSFAANEPFLGGIVWYDPYQSEGMTRAQAVAILAGLGNRVWLAPKDSQGNFGTGAEIPLSCTAFKDAVIKGLGKIVYIQCSYIGNLPAGEYQSHLEATYQGDPYFSANVTLDIE